MSKPQPTHRLQLFKLLCYFGCGLSLTLLRLYLDWTPATAIVPKTDNLTPNTTRLTSSPTPLHPPLSPRYGGRAEDKAFYSQGGSQTPPFPAREGGLGGLGLSYPSSMNLTSTVQVTTNNALNLFEQGKTLYQTGQFAAALDAWQKAATAYKTQGEPLNQAMTLSNLALAYQELGQWDEANQVINQSLTLLKTISPNTPAIAASATSSSSKYFNSFIQSSE